MEEAAFLSKVEWNELRLNESAVVEEVKRYLLQALRDSEKKLIELMESEIQATTYGQAPGKPAWRNELIQNLRVLEEDVTDEYMKASVGPDVKGKKYKLVRAMLIAYGSGNKVGNGSIEAGPYGRKVWTENLDGTKKSEEPGNYLLPNEFNQMGNHFIENAVKLMQKHFDDVLDAAVDSLPDSIFFGNVHVTEKR